MWRTERRNSCTWLRSGRPADTSEGRSWSALLTAGLCVKLWQQQGVTHMNVYRTLCTHWEMQPLINIGNAYRLLYLYELPLCLPAHMKVLDHIQISPMEKTTPHDATLWCPVYMCMCWWAATASPPSDVKPALSDHPSERPIRPRLDCGKRNFLKELS